jgi:diguanylate cyclase (GGDEF)-like protein
VSLARVLIVEDDVQQIHQLSHLLSDLAELHFALCGGDALQMAPQGNFDLVLLDAHLPDMNGLDVCVRLKCQEATADLPVVFITSRSDSQFQVDGFEHGAADFISKPIVPAILRARVKTQLRLKELADRLRRSALEDPLTGAANRRALDIHFQRELALAQRQHSPLALVLVDIDHFKAYNDLLGHPEGDACLQEVSRLLKTCCHRPSDVVARVGGEEFALLLPGSGLAGALSVAEHVLQACTDAALPHPGSPLGRVSVSMGASAWEPRTPVSDAARHGAASPGDAPREADMAIWQRRLTACADRALYRAKSLGRAGAQGERCEQEQEPANAPALERRCA